MHIPSLLAKKRDGHALEQNEIEWFIQHLQDIPNEQIGAFLMACQINGLNPLETTYLTKAMLEQGERLPLREGAVDKHSTGGVGDKTSFIIAPIAAAAVLATTPWSTFISFFIFLTTNPIEDLFDSLTRNISLGFPGLPPHLAAGAVGMASFLLNLIEKAFYRFGVNVDAFDAESAGKTASSHPRVASVVRLLESHA